MDFIAFDLETTGFLAGVDQIVEIGAIRFKGGQPEASFVSLVNPGIPMPEGASRVNGITDQMLQGQPKIETLLDPFAEFCGSLNLVAHNAPFDTQFLMADIKKYESAAPKGLILDSCAIARKAVPGLANYKLGTLVQHFNIPSSNFHRAEADAIYCGMLFWKMLLRMAPDGRFPHVDNLVKLTQKPEVRFPQLTKTPKQFSLLDGL